MKLDTDEKSSQDRSFDLREPIGNDHERQRRTRFFGHRNEKSLPVRRNAIRSESLRQFAEPRLKERLWLARSQRGRVHSKGHGHQLPVGRQIKKLSSVTLPSRHRATIRRDSPFRTCGRNALDEDLWSSHLP